jgi:hypothetical protein
MHDRRRVEEVEDPLRAGAGELADREDRGEHPHRGRELEHVRREREERAEADVVVHREPTTEREHRDLTERRDRLHCWLETRLHVHQSHAGCEHPLRARRQPFELAGLLPEALDHANTGHRFLDDVRDLAGLLLGVPARREHRRPQAHRREEQRRTDEQHHAREQRRQDEHRRHRDDEHQDVRDTDREELQETLDERDVG